MTREEMKELLEWILVKHLREEDWGKYGNAAEDIMELWDNGFVYEADREECPRCGLTKP